MTLRTGYVKWFDKDHGFGLISPWTALQTFTLIDMQ